MARLPNFLIIIRSEKLSGKGQGRGVGVRKKERFVLGKRTFRSQKSKHFVLRIIHGGINKGHGGKTMEEMETPFIIAGKNIKKGGAFEESMMQFDCASTIASVFNLEQPQVWIGRPMTQVFE